jgi:hypothetical protein
MAINTAFQPAYTRGTSISVTTTSASATIPAGNSALYLLNTGSTLCYVRVAAAAAAATTAGFPVPVNIPIVIGKGVDDVIVSAITASSTTTLLVIPGDGIL